MVNNDFHCHLANVKKNVIVVGNEVLLLIVLLTLWPWPLTSESQNSTTSSISQGHFLHQVWTLWDHFLSYAADKQTYRHDGLENPTQADCHSRLG